MNGVPSLTCPNCGGTDMTLFQVGKAGIKDTFTVQCSGCGRLIARVDLSLLVQGVELPNELEKSTDD